MSSARSAHRGVFVRGRVAVGLLAALVCGMIPLTRATPALAAVTPRCNAGSSTPVLPVASAWDDAGYAADQAGDLWSWATTVTDS